MKKHTTPLNSRVLGILWIASQGAETTFHVEHHAPKLPFGTVRDAVQGLTGLGFTCLKSINDKENTGKVMVTAFLQHPTQLQYGIELVSEDGTPAHDAVRVPDLEGYRRMVHLLKETTLVHQSNLDVDTEKTRAAIFFDNESGGYIQVVWRAEDLF